MKKPNYSERLKDPRWQKKRLEVLERESFMCEECGDSEKTLHVHHRYYISGRLPWEYPGFCFQCLCEECHELAYNTPETSRADGHYGITDWEIALEIFGGVSSAHHIACEIREGGREHEYGMPSSVAEYLANEIQGITGVDPREAREVKS